MTDHYLLMTATPHKGDPENFCLFLSLLDEDVYASVRSLEDAMARNSAPFYLRRTKEALVLFPDPDTGAVQKLFTNRDVSTVGFELDGDEFDFYEELRRYVEDQIDAAGDETARGRVVGFTMIMLQRRMASSIYAVRRSLQRMRERREKILADPAAYRQAQLERYVPGDFDDRPEDERQAILDDLEGVVPSVAEGVQPAVAGRAKRKPQLDRFAELAQAEDETAWGISGAPAPGTITLDRVHQAMILFGSGRAEALKHFLVEQGVGRDQGFWRLAQALSVLYPTGTDEKRWVDGVLARKRGLGL
jgi:hypothetical protein